MSSRPKQSSKVKRKAPGVVDAGGIVTTSGSSAFAPPADPRPHNRGGPSRTAKTSKTSEPLGNVSRKAKTSANGRVAPASKSTTHSKNSQKTAPLKPVAPRRKEVVVPALLEQATETKTKRRRGASFFDYMPSLTGVPFIVSVHFVALVVAIYLLALR